MAANFAIRNHNMTVVEVEGTLCEPFEVSSLDIMQVRATKHHTICLDVITMTNPFISFCSIFQVRDIQY